MFISLQSKTITKTIMIYTKKIQSGYYKVLDTTFGDQGWRLEKDETLEGSLVWVINNIDNTKLNEMVLEPGYDQLWQTKWEAKECLEQILNEQLYLEAH